MNFILKKLGKKAISLICAAAILISCITVGFGSLAGENAPVAPYTVDMSSPAIPMTALTRISLDNIDVIFPGDTIATDGTEIDWAADASASIIRLSGTDLLAFAKGVAKLTATKKSGGEAVDIYAVIKNPEDTTWDIYAIDFTTVDAEYKKLGYVNGTPDTITYNGAAISASNPAPAYPTGWQAYYLTPVTGGKQFNRFHTVMPFYYNDGTALKSAKGIVPFSAPQEHYSNTKHGNTGYFVLNNEYVNAFSDYTVTTNVLSQGGQGQNAHTKFTLAGRVELKSDGTPKLDAATNITSFGIQLHDACSYSGHGTPQIPDAVTTVASLGTAPTVNITSGGTSAATRPWNTSELNGVAYCLKYQACGRSQNERNFTFSVKYSGETATLFSNNDTTNSTFTIESSQKKGAVAFVQDQLDTWLRETVSSLQSFKVSLNNAPDDYPAYSTDLGAYIVSNESPAIPMNVGTMISVSDLLVEDSAGNLFEGDKLTFENVSGDTNAVVIDNAAGTITSYKKGTFKVRVTKGGNEIATVWVVSKLLTDTEWVLYETTFGDSDYNNLAYVDPDNQDATAISSSNRVNGGVGKNDYITYNGTKISATNYVPFPNGWNSYFTSYKEYTYDADGFANGTASSAFGISEYPSVMPYVNRLSGRNVNSGIVPFENAYLLGYRHDPNYPKAFNSYFVLNNEVVNAFTNYTINTNLNAYGAHVIANDTEQITVGVVGRVQLDDNGKLIPANAGSVSGLTVRVAKYDLDNGTAAVFNSTLSNTGATTYTETTGSNGDSVWDYVQDKHPHYYSKTATGVNLNMSVKYEGGTATLYSPFDTTGETFSVAATERAGAAAVVFTGQGTNTYFRNSGWVNVLSFKVTLNNADGNCPDYVDLGIYSVTGDEPAIPMYAGSYISTNSFSVATASGDVYMGNTVKLENVSGNSGIEIDNTIGRITAYKKGTYEVAVKDAATDALLTTVYVIVKNKGDATWDIYSIEFGEEEYKNLSYVDPDNIHTKYSWNNTAYLGSETNDYIAYNGNKVTSAANGVAFPEGWGSYFTKHDGTLGTYPTVMPYDNFVTGRAKATSGIVPFEVPGRIGLDTLPLVDGKEYFTFRQTNAYFILNNDAVNAFSNYTVTTNLNNYNAWGTEDGNGARFTVGIVGRVQYDAEGNVPTDSSAVFNGFAVNPGDKQNGTRGTVYVHAGTTGATPGNTAVDNKFWNYLTGLNHNASTMQPNGVNMTLRTVFDGDTMSLSSPLDKEGVVYTAASTKQKGGIGITLTGLSCWEGSRKTSWVNVKTVTVSLNNVDGECPNYTAFNYFVTADSPYIYGTVGDEINKSDMVIEIGGKFYVGDSVEWAVNNSQITVSADKITLNTKGTATATVTKNGKSLTVTFAIKGIDEEFFSNGNYKFTEEGGDLIAIKPLDSSEPFSTEITVPDRLENADGTHTNIYGVAANIGSQSGAYNVNIEKLTFGKYISSIGEGAFANATALHVVELPERLVEIGANAFKGTALEKVVIPARTDKIGAGAFANCENLTEIRIGNPDIVIGEGAFSANTTVYGPAAIKEAVEAAGGKFVEEAPDELDAAAGIRANILTIEANRVNVTDTGAVFYAEWMGTTYGYYITSFVMDNRDAGKIEITTDMKLVVDGKLVSAGGNKVSPRGMFKNSVDTRAVENIVYGAGTSVYGDQMAYMTSLKSVTLPSTLSSTGHNLLRGCTGLTEITLPANLEMVGMDIFGDCTSLEKIIIPENSKLARFGWGGYGDPQRAWMQNTAVKEIYLPVTVTELTPAVFGTTGIEKITVSNKNAEFVVTEEKDKMFPNNTVVYGVKGSTAEAYVNEYKAKYGYTFVAIDDFYTVKAGVVDSNAQFTVSLVDGTHYAVTGYLGIGGKVIVPAAATATDGVKNAPIYAISANTFQTAENGAKSVINRLINLEISEGIYEIDENTFKGASYLQSVKLPTSLKIIGKAAFATTGLKGTVEIPKNVTEIGAGAFQGAKDITDVYIYNASAVIKGSAFEKTVKIHGIKGSTAEAYATSNGMEFVEIPAPSKETVSDISDNGNYSFTVENGVITGYSRVDDTKPYSRKVVIPATVGGVKITAIGEGIFEQGAEASSVYAVVISKGITDIGAKAFYNAKALTLIDFGTVANIGDSAFEGTALAGDLVLPESIAAVGQNAFKGIKSLDSISVLNDACVLKPNSIPRVNANFVLFGNTGSSAEKFAETYKITFEYLDGGPEVPPEEETPKEDPNENVGDVINPPDDSQQSDNNVIVPQQLDLTLVIVIAAAVILLVLILGAGAIIIVVIMARRNAEDEE